MTIDNVIEPSADLFDQATQAAVRRGGQVVYLALRYVQYEGYGLPLRVSSTAMGAVRACTRDAGRARAKTLDWVWGLTYAMEPGTQESQPLWAIRTVDQPKYVADYVVLALPVSR